jgi:hypothetical protein
MNRCQERKLQAAIEFLPWPHTVAKDLPKFQRVQQFGANPKMEPTDSSHGRWRW